MGNKCETGNVKRFFLLLLGSFLSLSAWAQTGVICGTVSDAKFKDALIGASVVIEGTTVGAIADVEGNFRIENVKPGKYTIVASYVSYKSETIRDVVVKAHQESVLRIELSDADLQLQNVVVVAQRKLGTETAIINTVRKSLPVVSGISAQQIGKTQDSDAAEGGISPGGGGGGRPRAVVQRGCPAVAVHVGGESLDVGLAHNLDGLSLGHLNGQPAPSLPVDDDCLRGADGSSTQVE